MWYKVETVSINGSGMKTLDKKILEEIQPILDQGANNGWKLHSYTSQFAHLGKTLNIIVGPIVCTIIWEIEE